MDTLWRGVYIDSLVLRKDKSWYRQLHCSCIHIYMRCTYYPHDIQDYHMILSVEEVIKLTIMQGCNH